MSDTSMSKRRFPIPIEKPTGVDNGPSSVINTTVTHTVEHRVRVVAGYGSTLGTIIDNMVSDAIMRGDVLSDITISLLPEDWARIAKAHRTDAGAGEDVKVEFKP